MPSDQLSSEHRKALEQGSAITSEVIAARGYRTATDKKELATLGFSPVQCRVPSLLIPLYAPDGTPAGHQVRPDTTPGSVKTARHGSMRSLLGRASGLTALLLAGPNWPTQAFQSG